MAMLGGLFGAEVAKLLFDSAVGDEATVECACNDDEEAEEEELDK